MRRDPTSVIRLRAASRGITLMEMLVVVAVISLIAGLTYPGVSRGMERIRLHVAANDVAAFLSQAMNSVERTETPVELRFLKTQGIVEFAGPRTPYRALRLPDGIALSEVYPVPEEGFEPVRSVMLLPGGAFPALTVELAARSAGKRTVRIDPVTGTAVIEVLAAPLVVAPQSAGATQSTGEK